MADVRAMLRQTRTARAQAEKMAPSASEKPALDALGVSQNIAATSSAASTVAAQTATKRRRSDDVDMGEADDLPQSKRTRSDVSPAAVRPHIQIQVPEGRRTSGSESKKTPPLGRRSSGTPSHGVEMRIPSRPATPIATKDSFTSGSAFDRSMPGSAANPSVTTPKIGAIGRSPLIPVADDPAASKTNAAASASVALSEATSSFTFTAGTPPQTVQAPAAATIDEEEWAAFEAEVINAPVLQLSAPPAPNGSVAPTTAGAKPDLNGAGVISGPAVRADGSEVQPPDSSVEVSEGERRAAEEALLVDAREEASRALEEEFDDMQQLETRVRRLKETREALRAPGHTLSQQQQDELRRPSATLIDKDYIRRQLVAAEKDKAEEATVEEDDEDDEDDEDADWDAFRFKP